MKTKAHFKGHPIHPMFVAFPIAFLTGAMAADLVGRVMDRPGWWSGGAGLPAAGIIAALVAAVPGFVDYFFAVPPNSTAKKRATYHMLVNLGAVALFAIAWAVRGSWHARPSAVVIALEIAGVG